MGSSLEGLGVSMYYFTFLVTELVNCNSESLGRAGPWWQESWVLFGACPLQILPDQCRSPVPLLQQLPTDRRGRIWRHVGAHERRVYDIFRLVHGMCSWVLQHVAFHESHGEPADWVTLCDWGTIFQNPEAGGQVHSWVILSQKGWVITRYSLLVESNSRAHCQLYSWFSTLAAY